jgi:(p)ppGpp synthase/HD superfamily hydrolase
MSTLERAITIAAEAHAGQVDKAGEPYILHPLRVMGKVKPEARIPAVLHDVIEDCREWTPERLEAEGFHPVALSALDSVTRRKGEAYEAFIRRAFDNPIGRMVKIADLEDNMRIERIPNPTDDDWERMRKYGHALTYLYGKSPSPSLQDSEA